MFVEDYTRFPGNIVANLATFLTEFEPGVIVHKRPLRPTDDIQCWGVFATDRVPQTETKEMRGMPPTGFSFPTLHRHYITIQGMITDTQEDRGIATHSAMATALYAAVATSS